MKVLVISRNAWDDTNAIGNTLSNFFKGIDDLEFANIYFRSSNPNNNLCKRYYRVTETEVIKNWFSPQKIGKAFEWRKSEKKQAESNTSQKEKMLIRYIHKYNLKAAYVLSDYIWYSEKWNNNNLRKFIEEYAPDAIVTFAKSAPQYYLTIKYLKENYNIPLFSWIADDEYTGLMKKGALREIENLRYILKQSQIVRGCSEEICQYYNSVFDIKAVPLYKGCDLSIPVKEHVNHPIKITYAGNLLYGRLEIICKIADTLERYVSSGQKVIFEIYSNTLLAEEEKSYFEQKKCTRYMGKHDYEIIMQRLASTDVVLHVESFDYDQILKTKYSFSTKIIDCLQCGSILLAVGPKELASISYVNKIPGTCVIDSIDHLDVNLFCFLDDVESFGMRAKKIRKYAQVYHDMSIMKKDVENVMKALMKEGE